MAPGAPRGQGICFAISTRPPHVLSVQCCSAVLRVLHGMWLVVRRFNVTDKPARGRHPWPVSRCLPQQQMAVGWVQHPFQPSVIMCLGWCCVGCRPVTCGTRVCDGASWQTPTGEQGSAQLSGCTCTTPCVNMQGHLWQASYVVACRYALQFKCVVHQLTETSNAAVGVVCEGRPRDPALITCPVEAGQGRMH